MNSGFKSQCVPHYRLLTEAQIKRLHAATLELLETVGVRVMDAEARTILRDSGCGQGRRYGAGPHLAGGRLH